jgi:hypothetical protein
MRDLRYRRRRARRPRSARPKPGGAIVVVEISTTPTRRRASPPAVADLTVMATSWKSMTQRPIRAVATLSPSRVRADRRCRIATV